MAYYCHECQRSFGSAVSIGQHDAAKHNFPCPGLQESICNFVGRTADHLEAHKMLNGHCYCRNCHRFFVDPQALQQHTSALHEWTCHADSCLFVFPTWDDLAIHQIQMGLGHCYCTFCARHFSNSQGFEHHWFVKHCIPCPHDHCNDTFVTEDALEKHQIATEHCYCKPCDRWFVKSSALYDHLQHNPVHRNETFHCAECSRKFVNQQALDQHLENAWVHSEAYRALLSRYCGPCERWFKDEVGKKQHMESVKHKPIANIECMAKKDCERKFTSISAMLAHLESGACRSGCTRKDIEAMVAMNDTTLGIFRHPSILPVIIPQNHLLLAQGTRRYLTEIEEDEEESKTADYISGDAESVISGKYDSSTTCGDSDSEHGFQEQGSLTYDESSDDDYSSLQLINRMQSLNLAHRDQMPDTFSAICPSHRFLAEGEELQHVHPKEFSSVSGMVQHLESGACAGVENRKKLLGEVITVVKDRVKEMEDHGINCRWKGIGEKLGKVKLLN